jgi:hypothetical protein
MLDRIVDVIIEYIFMILVLMAAILGTLAAGL